MKRLIACVLLCVFGFTVATAAADAAIAAASQIMTHSVTGSVADSLLAKGIQDVREKLN